MFLTTRTRSVSRSLTNSPHSRKSVVASAPSEPRNFAMRYNSGGVPVYTPLTVTVNTNGPPSIPRPATSAVASGNTFTQHNNSLAMKTSGVATATTAVQQNAHARQRGGKFSAQGSNMRSGIGGSLPSAYARNAATGTGTGVQSPKRMSEASIGLTENWVPMHQAHAESPFGERQSSSTGGSNGGGGSQYHSNSSGSLSTSYETACALSNILCVVVVCLRDVDLIFTRKS